MKRYIGHLTLSSGTKYYVPVSAPEWGKGANILILVRTAHMLGYLMKDIKFGWVEEVE